MTARTMIKDDNNYNNNNNDNNNEGQKSTVTTDVISVSKTRLPMIENLCLLVYRMLLVE